MESKKVQKQTTKTTTTAKPADILPVSMAARLHLSMTEFEALDVIARVYQCSVEDVINTVMHRSVHAELEVAAPQHAYLKKLTQESHAVFEAAEAFEQEKDSKEIEVTTIVKVNRAKYEQFRRMYDEQTWQEFVDYCINSGHIEEMLGQNPDLMAAFLTKQNSRLYRKRKKEEA